MYCICIFSNKLDLKQETSFYYNLLKWTRFNDLAYWGQEIFKKNLPATNRLSPDNEGSPTDGLTSFDGAADVGSHGLAQGGPDTPPVALQLDDDPQVTGVDPVAHRVGHVHIAEEKRWVLIKQISLTLTFGLFWVAPWHWT